MAAGGNVAMVNAVPVNWLDGADPRASQEEHPMFSILVNGSTSDKIAAAALAQDYYVVGKHRRAEISAEIFPGLLLHKKKMVWLAGAAGLAVGRGCRARYEGRHPRGSDV